CHVSNAPLLGSALMLSHSRTSLRNSASSGVSSKSTPILLVRLQRVWATTRVFPQSAGPNGEPTENVAVRAEPLCGEARAESIWRSQVGPALVGGQLAVHTPVRLLHVLEDDVHLLGRGLADAHHGLGDGRGDLALLLWGAAGVPLHGDVGHGNDSFHLRRVMSLGKLEVKA